MGCDYQSLPDRSELIEKIAELTTERNGYGDMCQELQSEIEELKRCLKISCQETKAADLKIAELKGEWVEWFCELCKTIYPIQSPGYMLQVCPQCRSAMIPTSYNLRKIAELRAALAKKDREIAEQGKTAEYLVNLVFELRAKLAETKN